MKKLSLIHFFLWLAILMNALFSLSSPNVITSMLATIFYVTLVILLFKEMPIAFLLFSPILFLHFSVLISLNAIEFGGFMKEMGRTGYPSAASAVYVIVVGLFLFVASKVFSRLETTRIKPLRIDSSRHVFLTQWAALLFVCFALLYLISKGMFTGFPLLSGFDRFEYRRISGDGITLNLLNLKIVIASFLGLSAANCVTTSAKLRHHFIYILYVIISFLFADKFFIIISASFYYLAVQSAFKPELIKENAKKLFIPGIVAMIVAAVITIYIYSANGMNSPQKTADLLADRFAAQGQLWFVAFNEEKKWVDFDSEDIILNAKSLVANPAQDYVFEKHLGAFYFVFKYAPIKMMYSFIRNAGSVTPTMVFEAYGFAMFGFIGLLCLIAITGAGLGFVGAKVMKAIYSGNPFNILLPSYIFVQLYYFIVSGTIFNLFGIGTLKAYAAFLLLQMCVSFWIKSTSNNLPSAR